MTQPMTIFSAVQPTGALTLGNYIGALATMRQLSQEHRCFFAVADLHSLTVDIPAAQLRANVASLYAMYLACGLGQNPETVLFVQSGVPAHSELAWILDCHTQFGEASRMTQFKEKGARHQHNVNVGLFAYPVLMAADILLYQTTHVPVGDDQRQHLELARVIAERFNNRYSPTFVVPEGIINQTGARIYSLADPTVKMSKSDPNTNAYILLTDDAQTIRRKVARAVTDSGDQIIASPDKPGITNLLAIYCAMTQIPLQQAQAQMAGRTYAEFKSALAEAVIAVLEPIQARYSAFLADKPGLEQRMSQGRERARAAALRTMSKVRRKVGLID